MYALNSSASTVPTFTITRNELPNEEVNSVSLTVSGGGGVNADTTLELGTYNATAERIEREIFPHMYISLQQSYIKLLFSLLYSPVILH